ncbi:MAG TPA: hypothetical protein VFC47_01165 [Caulobacteraceae bacterium]|nr:hypothetical protein [Caulobacteraceae bacterium]
METKLDLPLDNARYEAFAQARAAGRTTHEAARLAGYPWPEKKAAELWRRADIIARTKVILERRGAGGSRDLGGLIDRLITLAETAVGVGDAKGMDVARACLAEAAKLKQLLPSEPASRGSARAPAMSLPEWRAKFDPTAQRGPEPKP